MLHAGAWLHFGCMYCGTAGPPFWASHCSGHFLCTWLCQHLPSGCCVTPRVAPQVAEPNGLPSPAGTLGAGARAGAGLAAAPGQPLAVLPCVADVHAARNCWRCPGAHQELGYGVLRRLQIAQHCCSVRRLLHMSVHYACMDALCVLTRRVLRTI